MSEPRIRCGDHIHDSRSGEELVVAFADYETGDLAWCGWPEGLARIADCRLVYQATDKEHAKLAREIVAGGSNDMRGLGVRRLYPELFLPAPPARVTLPELLEIVVAAAGPSSALDAQIELAMRVFESGADVAKRWQLMADGRLRDQSSAMWSTVVVAQVTASLEAAIALVQRMLPGWWWKCGTCCVSDDACIAPDINSPTHGARLARELGPIDADSEFDAGFDVDRRPAGNVPLALLEALIRALIAVEARKAEALADA